MLRKSTGNDTIKTLRGPKGSENAVYDFCPCLRYAVVRGDVGM